MRCKEVYFKWFEVEICTIVPRIVIFMLRSLAGGAKDDSDRVGVAVLQFLPILYVNT